MAHLRLPWWLQLPYGFTFVVAAFWYVTIPAAIVLASVGWYGADWLGGLRWAMFGAVVLLALPFPLAAVAFVIQEMNAAACWRTLDRDETVAGLQLPAGSRIRFADTGHSSVVSIDLPHVTNILGMRLVGKLKRYNKWDEIDPVWSGTLAEDQRVDGLPCPRSLLE